MKKSSYAKPFKHVALQSQGVQDVIWVRNVGASLVRLFTLVRFVTSISLIMKTRKVCTNLKHE